MPDWKQDILRRLAPLKLAPVREAEIAEELAQHLEDRYRELLARGAEESKARRAAMAELRDESALMKSLQPVENSVPTDPVTLGGGGSTNILGGIAQDLRHGVRMLWKSPAVAAIAILTLAFGIGANSAIFAVVDTLVLRPLPYQDSARLVAIGSVEKRDTTSEPWVSMLDFFDFRAQSQCFSSMAGISPVWNDVATINSVAERLQSLYVSASFFPMLGVKPAVGRVFTTAEDKPGAGARVVVLSYSYWRRQFGGDASIIGKPLDINGIAFTVIGVTPRDFHYLGEPVAGTPASIDLWMPLATNQIAGLPRYVRFLKVIAKLKPGVSLEPATVEVNTIGAALGKQYADADAGLTYQTSALAEQVSGRIRPAMMLLLGAVGLVLLMACANVANLLLTAAIARGREVAVRAALGASQFRLVRQFLTESCVLAGLGMLLGLALAYGILRALLAAAPATLLEGRAMGLDGRALVFTLAAAAASALLAGLPPAWRVLRRDIARGLHEGGYNATSGHRRFRAALVVAQMSLALALLIGAGLLMDSFVRLLQVNPGFDAQHVATITTLLPQSANTEQKGRALDKALIDRLVQIPGVRAAGEVSRLPLQGSNLGSWIWIDGKTYAQGAQPSVEYRVASPGYFQAMGLPLLAGRCFAESETGGAAARVAVVNQAAAEAFWPGQSAVGRRIKLGANPDKQEWINVVGVIGNEHYFGLDKGPQPEIYRPLEYSALGNPILVARVDGKPAGILREMGDAVRSVAPGMPAYNAFSMSTLVERSTEQRRFIMLLLIGFAVAALLLAAIGIYGTISQSVAQRTRELGLRMALGASQGRVLQMILRQGMSLAATGVALGGMAAALLAQLMRALLFEVAPLDPAVFACAATVLLLAAALACLAPALRATRVDPMVALRHE